jgi:nucleotide-binding universal stress UspA family protein
MIVVGVDGSAGSRRALRWAYGEAELRACTVEVVSAWTTEEHQAAESQRHVVDGLRRELVTSAETSCRVVHGVAVDVLVQASSGADLLVVGNHDISSLRHAGQESVSAACARLAECPCVVVPAPPPPKGHLGQEVVHAEPVPRDSAVRRAASTRAQPLEYAVPDRAC